MKGYKLFRKRKDGTYGPLFINAKMKLLPGVVYKAEDHPTPGYAHRPGWHICAEPFAPHLANSPGRVWCEVEFELRAEVERPRTQGQRWFLGDSLRILKEVPLGGHEAPARLFTYGRGQEK